jgi:hypothetical protein
MFAGAIVGGCASVIGGGKFESGAVTGAFTALVASVVNPATRQQFWGDVKNIPGDVWNLPTNTIGGTLGSISVLFGAKQSTVTFVRDGVEYNRTVYRGGLFDKSVINENFAEAISFGDHVLCSSATSDWTLRHEFGHGFQANVLGPLYVPTGLALTNLQRIEGAQGAWYNFFENQADAIRTTISIKSSEH